MARSALAALALHDSGGHVKRSTLYSIAVVFAIAALFFIMTTARAKVECRVCMNYHGTFIAIVDKQLTGSL